MIEIRTLLFAESDHHHLHQAALDGTIEICVCLDTIERNDVVCFSGISIKENR